MKIYAGGVCRAFSSHLPPWVAGAEGGIDDFEMAGIIYGICIAAEFDPGRAVILCCDNTCAASALVRGRCQSDLSREMCSTIWSVAAACALHVWIEHVAGKLNPADPPSRDCRVCSKPSLAKEKRCVVPLSFHRILSHRESLFRSQTRVAAGSGGFMQAWPCPKPTAETAV